jgi:hypothetical protein
MAPVLHRLDQEWSVLARSPRARRALMRWAATQPALTGYRNLDDVLQARRDPDRARPVLHALAVLAPVDDLAARTLLQAMIPGLVCLSGTSGNDDPDAIDELVSLAWERIRTYPAHRAGSVPGNILLDVRKRYRRHRRIHAPTGHELPVEPPDTASTEDVALDRALLGDLARAQRAGTMTAAVLSTIVRTRLLDEPLATLAAEQRITARLLRQRRWRAELRLRDLALAG